MAADIKGGKAPKIGWISPSGGGDCSAFLCRVSIVGVELSMQSNSPALISLAGGDCPTLISGFIKPFAYLWLISFSAPSPIIGVWGACLAWAYQGLWFEVPPHLPVRLSSRPAPCFRFSLVRLWALPPARRVRLERDMLLVMSRPPCLKLCNCHNFIGVACKMQLSSNPITHELIEKPYMWGEGVYKLSIL